MALKVFWTKAALNDLESAADYISRDSSAYAAVFVRESIEASRSLNRFAMRGRVVPEMGDASIRELFVCNYRLIYRVSRTAVHIVGFMHGSRDLWTLRKKR